MNDMEIRLVALQAALASTSTKDPLAEVIGDAERALKWLRTGAVPMESVDNQPGEPQ